LQPKFGKAHRDVLRGISNLECTPGFTLRNFAQCNYIDKQGVKRTEYLMTQDGFTFLVMGFTGYLAAQFKEEYINAFNAMRSKIQKSHDLDRREFELAKHIFECEKKGIPVKMSDCPKRNIERPSFSYGPMTPDEKKTSADEEIPGIVYRSDPGVRT